MSSRPWVSGTRQSSVRDVVLHNNLIFFLATEDQELIQAAREARKFAYVPYSNFPVGAALRCDGEIVYTGCNIENGAFSPTVCAERTAAVKAISEGRKKFTAVAVVAFQEKSFTTPCGVCRQFLAEFVAGVDVPVFVAKPESSRVLVTTFNHLLPFSFVTKFE